MEASESSAAQSPQVSRRRLLASRLFRLTCVALVVALAWSTAGTFIRLLDDHPEPAAAENPQSPPPADIDWSRIADPSGSWRLGQSAWSPTVRRLTDAELAAAWKVDLPATSSAAPPDRLEQSVLRMLQTTRATPTSRGRGRRYEARDPDVRWVVDTVGEGAEQRITSARFGIRGDSSTWTLLEFTPAPAADRQSTSVGLLSYPLGAQPAASRCDSSGRTVCEFVEVPASPEQLIEHWRQAGFDPQAADPPSTASSRRLTAANMCWVVCRRDGRTISAALLHSAGSGTTIVIASPAITSDRESAAQPST